MKRPLLIFIFLSFAIALFAGHKLPRIGVASFYGPAANHRRTASGERYCSDSFTAACHTLAFGTYLKVTNLSNSKSVIVRVNDRGPHRRHRLIDLSGAAAQKIGIMGCGLGRVKVELASQDEIVNRDRFMSKDSLPMDSAATSCTPAEQIYMVQAGIFRIKKNALHIKAYLYHHHINPVTVKRISSRRRKMYKVLIGPLNTKQKDKALMVLNSQCIKALVETVK